MLVMCAAGGAVAVARSVAPAINVPAAVITAYLVITSLAAIRPPTRGTPALLTVGMFVALGVGVVDVVFAYEALTSPTGRRHGMPAFPFLMFGIVGLVGAAGDLRLLRSEPPRGRRRLVRHLWRMTFALFIAAMSFFIGQADVFPRAIRTPAVLAPPVVAVLLAMCYWLWRLRPRRSVRGDASVGAAAAPARMGRRVPEHV
jgi:hypothetical protein